ncbi:MAG: hypothetical protein IKS17_08460 [Firmicutes bacterium]|nr:hypothetical protein [Bacillota bacterium]
MTVERMRNITVSTLLIVGGVLTASYSLTEYNHWNSVRLASGKTSAVVTNLAPTERQNVVGVSYSVEGKQYDTFIISHDKDLQVGQRVTVYYDKTAPARTVNKPDFVNMLYGLAAIQILGGVAVLVWDPE